MTKAASTGLAADLKAAADMIGATLSPLDQACLGAGAHLQKAIPDFNNLATLFETLARSLENQAIGEASDDLEKLAGELARAAHELSDESRVLQDLLSLNRSIGARLADLLASLRTISTLVFSMKIEAAPLIQSEDDLAPFTEGLAQLSNHARRALDEFQAAHGKLEDILRSSSVAQADFQHLHQTDLTTISSGIAECIAAVADMRRRTLVAARDIGALSRRVGDEIGQCVVALQVGDSTRQRLEHVRGALDLSVDQLTRGDPASAAPHSDEAPPTSPEGVASRLCHLQALQLEGALDEFTRDIETVLGALGDIAKDAGALANRGRTLFGASDLKRSSSLEILERKLAAARAIIAECQRARAVVDQATIAVATTMSDLQQRISALLEIVGDVSTIGVNALLKSKRLGERGRGFSVLAQELRSCSARIAAGIHDLPPALAAVVECAGRFSQTEHSLDSRQLARLNVRMNTAIQAFSASGKQMSAALERLEQEAESVRKVLDQAAAALAAHESVELILHDAVGALAAIATRLGGSEERTPDVDTLLDQWLRPSYSMASERMIHDEFTGRGDDEAPAAAPGLAEDDPLSAIML